MKNPLLTLSIIATVVISGLAVAGSEANRFEGVEVSIPVLSHDYYLGKNSGATHYWHGENRDARFTGFLHDARVSRCLERSHSVALG